jgi:hypothetical protein
MATKSLSFRAVLELFNDRGDSAASSIDETLTLSGFKGVTHRRFTLANAASDEAFTMASDVCLVAIVSHDHPFSLRLNTGEILLSSAMCWLAVGSDVGEIMLEAGDLLLSGNGANDSDLEIVTIDVVP